MKTFYSWLVYSSTNPDKVSLTVKGFGSFAVVFVLFFQLVGVHIGAADVVAVFAQLAAVVSALLGLFGLVRKIAITARQ